MTGTKGQHKIRVILWDFDGTLTNFEKAQSAALRAGYEAFGYGPCDDDCVQRYAEHNRAVWRRVENEEVDKAVLLVQRFEDFFRAEGLPTDRAEEFNRFFQLALGDTIVYNDHSYELVSNLKGKIAQYIVTNGTLASQNNKLAKSGFGDLVEGAFVSEATGYDKPAGGYFDYVFAHIPDCPRDQILIVGDSLTSDMQGGVNQGLVTAWYNPAGLPMPEDMPIDYDLRDLNEVRKII